MNATASYAGLTPRPPACPSRPRSDSSLFSRRSDFRTRSNQGAAHVTMRYPPLTTHAQPPRAFRHAHVGAAEQASGIEVHWYEALGSPPSGGTAPPIVSVQYSLARHVRCPHLNVPPASAGPASAQREHPGEMHPPSCVVPSVPAS